ncbi:hypothetical protein PMI05_00473 [Brevibacillus sp. BC25]|nr:hypothetical protein PMI05_00473 [Brevibacillus sp. BC25]
MKKILSAVIATSILAVYSGGAYASTKTDSSVRLEVNENAPTQIMIPSEFFDPNHPKAIKDPQTIKKFESILKEIEAKDKTLVSSADNPPKDTSCSGLFRSRYWASCLGSIRCCINRDSSLLCR